MFGAILLCIVVALGIFLRYRTKNYPFLELICNVAALVIFIYELLGLLPQPAIPRTVLKLLLILGGSIYAVTELLLLLAARGTAKSPCDCIIVLGCKIADGIPSPSLQDRTRAAADYLKQHPHALAVLSGGRSEGEDISEARYMFHVLTETGIAPQRLFLEEESLNTWENLGFSTKLIAEKFAEKPTCIGLLSSEYHLFRAAMHAKTQGLTIVTIPARTSKFFIKLNGFLREGAGVWHQLILGGTYHDRTKIR